MLKLKDLPFKNLKAYMGRTVALLIFAMLMTVAFFGGTMMIGGVRQGLSTLKSRLGADILVTPESAAKEFDAQTVLLQAEPGYFYMDRSMVDEIAAIDGVGQISPQLFMASAKAGCCSARLQMIAFDPATDFTVQPWIADTFEGGELGKMDVFVGSNVTVYENHIIRFYDMDCRIVGQFAPTGSTLDSCVYMNMDTVKELIQSSFIKGLNQYDEYDPDKLISAITIRVSPGKDIEEVVESIRQNVSGVSVATSRNMVSGIGESLERIEKIVIIFICMLWSIGMFMTVLIFVLMIFERKREFASLTAMGASRKMVAGIVRKEAVCVNIAGGALGILISGVILGMFRGLIEQSLGIGFVLPNMWVVALLAIAALLSVILAAVLSSGIAIHRISRMDASEVLKEAE